MLTRLTFKVTFITVQEPVFQLSQCRQTVIAPNRINQPVKVWAQVNGAKSSDNIDGAAIHPSAPVIMFRDNATREAVTLKNWSK